MSMFELSVLLFLVDHSLVKLSTSGEDDKENYINANYLPVSIN